MCIYFTKSHEKPTHVHDKIGHAWGTLFNILEKNDLGKTSARATKAVRKALSFLGVEAQDPEAYREITTVVQKIAEAQEVQFLPHENGNVFFVAVAKEPEFSERKLTEKDVVAVFKIGRQRAAMELLVRKVAKFIGFSNPSCGIFTAVQGLELKTMLRTNHDSLEEKSPPELELRRISPENFSAETLWNGRVKEFQESSPEQKIVGALFPYIRNSTTSSSLPSLAKAVVTTLLLGSKDIKDDAILDGINPCGAEVKAVITDSEESFSPLASPSSEKEAQEALPSINLPFLKLPICEKSLDVETVEALSHTLSRVNISKLIKFLQDQKINFEDRSAETLFEETEEPDDDLFSDEDSVSTGAESSSDLSLLFSEETVPDFENFGTDDGGCWVRISEQKKEPRSFTTDGRILTEAQINSIVERTLRLKIYLNNCLREIYLPNLRELANAADPIYEYQVEYLRRSETRLESPFEVAGADSPKKILADMHGSPPVPENFPALTALFAKKLSTPS